MKYPESLSRVIALLDRLEAAESTVVVVDNRQPGDWVHEVSSRLIHIGGDNSAWEFSAFDRGIRFLERRKVSGDVFAFVTDALLAYGDDFLRLIDDHALDVCAKAKACVGWVDSLPEAYEIADRAHHAHLRTSFLLMPAAVVTRIAPLTTPLEPGAIFGPSASHPFRGDAPLSASVRSFLLAWLTTGSTLPASGERWHSAFELDGDTFDFFRAKVLAILRELSLSARLAAAKVPCFDVRLIRSLALTGMPLTERLAVAVREWQWRDWCTRRILPVSPFHNIDVCRIPESIAHGDAAHIVLEGWVGADPQVREVEVVVGESTYRARCDIARSDVLAAHPELRDEFMGFRFSIPLDALRPGVHAVGWRVPGTSLEEALGRLRVLPSIGFEIERAWVPDTPGPDGDLPFAIVGRVVSSTPLGSIRMRWDGVELSCSHAASRERLDGSGRRTSDLIVRGAAPAPCEPRQHTLELWFETETGETAVWRQFVMVQASRSAGPHCLSVREVGPFDPEMGTTRIRLRGFVYARPGEVLALLRHGQGIVEQPLAPRAAAEVSSPAWFDFEREVTALPPGEWPLALVLRRPGAEDRELLSWVERVRLLRPVLHLDLVQAQPGPAGGQYLLRLDGWVENDFIVSFLSAAVDGVPVGRIDLDVPRPDVAAATGNSLTGRQGFHCEMPLRADPGRHELALTAIQGDGEPVVWRHGLHLDPHPVQRFGLDSEDLEALRRPGAKTFWSSFVARGSVRSSLPEVCASLSVDGITVDEQRSSGDRRFSLRYAPRQFGSHTVRVRFEAAGQSLFDSGPARVAIRPLKVPDWTGEALGQLLEELVPGRSLGHGLTPHDVVHRLLEARPEGISQLLTLLSRVRDRGTVRRSAPLPRDPSPADGPSLSVLMASWHVPSFRHGGGVYISNLLKELGRRHRITVVHAFNPDEAGWEAAIRPFVSELISVPRGHTRTLHRRDPWIPLRYEECYTPALRRAIECEVATGKYDLVDYEDTAMLPHYEGAEVPRVQTLLELSHLAVATSCLRESSSRDDTVEQVALLLEAYHLETMVLPAAARHLVTVSLEDGAALARGQDRADVYVNPIPVDADRLAPPAGNERIGDSVAFLGNFRHPPNVEAAKFLVTEVMPRIRGRQPDARLLIIGPYAPDELTQLVGDRADVELTGFLEDFRPPLWRAAAFLAPIFSGAGMRVKVAEAMACGCPLVSSRLGVNGLEAEDGVHYLNAEDADGFAEAACQLMSDRGRADRLGNAARRLILDIHGCEARAAEREAIWRRAVSLHASEATPRLGDRPTRG